MALQKFQSAGGSPANIIIRLAVGGVFFLEGIKKFLFYGEWGAGRFARIGIPVPGLMGPFVGAVETVCGLLLLLGLFTRLASLPLIIDISVAIATTKIPIFVKSGFWPMEAEARTDFCMLMGLIFLLIAGAGPLSADKLIAPRPRLK
jgi:putative oxidoreductase